MPVALLFLLPPTHCDRFHPSINMQIPSPGYTIKYRWFLHGFEPKRSNSYGALFRFQCFPNQIAGHLDRSEKQILKLKQPCDTLIWGGFGKWKPGLQTDVLVVMDGCNNRGFSGHPSHKQAQYHNGRAGLWDLHVPHSSTHYTMLKFD